MPTFSDWELPDWLTFVMVTTAAVTGIALAWSEIDKRFYAPKRHKARRLEELNDPLDAHFLVPPLSQRTIEYAEQDGREHLLAEIALSPNTSTLVELRLHPRTRFVTSSFLFGCFHEDSDLLEREDKPRPVELIDVYGQGYIPSNSRPDETPGHKINSRFQYRWNYETKWNARTTLVVGIRIETRSEGKYRWQMHFIGDEADVIKELSIVVVDQNAAPMLVCVNGDHERHRIAPKFMGTRLVL